MHSDAIPDATRTKKITASLMAGALGDSMGADAEFMLDLDSIRAVYPDGIDRLGLTLRPGWFTDDTQMTLFTAEGLIEAAATPDQHPVLGVHAALNRWYLTQLYERPSSTSHGLAAEPELYYDGAPGSATMAALAQRGPLGQPVEETYQKGCGTIMRVAPVAYGVPRTAVRDIAVRTSAVTHGNPIAHLAAAAWAELLADVIALEAAPPAAVEEIARRRIEEYAGLSDAGLEVADAMRAALDAPRDAQPETVQSLGGGWVAEEALTIALYAGIVSRDLDHGLQTAIIHEGDSDSTGAIAGNLLGLMYPEQVPAHPLLNELGGKHLIEKMANGLAAIDLNA